MKRIIAGVLVAVVAICMIAGCAQKANDSIIGRWESEYYGETIIMEFTEDGNLTIGPEGYTETVKYKYEDGIVYLSYDGENWDDVVIKVESLEGNNMHVSAEEVEYDFKRK